ncbi:MAG: MFS transporter [Acidobacteriia bacterium]|nr:MFS transporter [Terriglobia bacterium]
MTTLKTASRIPFTSHQRKILLALASTVGLRMLGLFLVLPVFTLYGLQFTSSKFLVGFAFGCYGLTMALLQIPFGRLSDHIGRRKVLILGMALFSVGSFVCAVPHWFPPPASIVVLIVGRLVQGGGAIISVAFAAVADHIEPERRSTAMAVLGIPIGASFVVGVVGGPLLAGLFGTASLFWLTGILGLLSDTLLVRYLPETPASSASPAPLGEVMRNRPVVVLGIGGFLMNFFMASFFFYFPLIVTGQHHLKMTHYYSLLLPMMFISGVTMFGFSRGADRGWGRRLSALAFLMFLPSVLVLFEPGAMGFNPARLTGVLVAGTLFYIGFTGLEPVLPSLVSRYAPPTAYGTALGAYNSLQFLGSFAGGALSGALSHLASTQPTMALLITASVAGTLLMLSQPKN